MKTMKTISLALAVALTASVAYAQLKPVELRAIRLTSPDPAKLVQFYDTTFGFKPIKGPVPGSFSIGVIGGGRMAVAKSATPTTDEVAHLILNVANVDATVAKAKTNGATLLRGPEKSPINNYVAYIRDPGGNVVELVGPMPGANKIF